MIKIVYLLIGLKESGKSYVWRLIEKSFSIKFLQVENFFISSFKELLDKNNNI